jgi:hypothetical protein
MTFTASGLALRILCTEHFTILLLLRCCHGVYLRRLQVFGAVDWQALQQQVLCRYHRRCAVTAVSAAVVPLQVVPEWRIDHINRQVSLVGLYPLCEPVQQLREQLQQQQSASELDQQASAAIIGQFAALMQWSENSVARYAAHAQRLQKLMVDERWQLELSAAVDFLAA